MVEKWPKIRVTLEKSKERIAKYADCWVKAQSEKSELDTVYRENTLPYRTVSRWVSYFKEGRSSVKDEGCLSRPVLATSENDVATVQSFVWQDSQYTVEEISDLLG